ncbi:MAG TPA: ABC transporter permease [Limnochordales bacterium]
MDVAVEQRARGAAAAWTPGVLARGLGRNLLPIVGLVAVWEALSRLGLVHPRLLPGPSVVLGTLWDLARQGLLVQDVYWSLRRLLLSSALGMSAGVVLGIVMGKSRLAELALVPPIQFILSIPGVAILPIAILWFGLTETTVIAVLTLETAVTVAVNAWTGVKTVDATLLNAARTLGSRGADLFLRVLLPASLPSIIAGFRQGMSRAWRVLVAGEMVAASQFGLGYRVFEAQEFFHADVMYAGVVTVGLLGFALERLLFRSLEVFTVERWGVMREL